MSKARNISDVLVSPDFTGTVTADGLTVSSGSNQIGLDTGNIGVYGTLNVGHFANGAFIGTASGTNAASNLLRLGTGGVERMRIDANGNLGLGVVPETDWASAFEVLQIGQAGAVWANNNDNSTRLSMNVKYDGAYKRINANKAANLTLDSAGSFVFDVAATGAADSAISWTNAMTIDNTGNLTMSSATSPTILLTDTTNTVSLKAFAGNTSASLGTTTAHALSIFTNDAERLRIDANGNLLTVKSASSFSNTGVELQASGSNWMTKANGPPLSLNRTGNNGYIIQFHNDGTQVGDISIAGSSTAYNTSSDHRLKTNVQPMTGATATFMQLNPVNFEWIADGTRVNGFLAHELQAVIPESATGTHNGMMDEEYQATPATGDIYTAGTEAGFTEVSTAIQASPAYYDINGVEIKAEVLIVAAVHEAFDAVAEVIHSSDVEQPETLEDGQQWRETTAQVMATRSVPDMQGIDQAKVVPLLVATLQEALAEIETLKTRLTALEE